VRAAPCVAAHRGAARIAPENTLAAFSAALDAGAAALELDVRLTRDGRIVVIHAGTLACVPRNSGVLGACAG
jgi:glycerophosphoryl diester phosphodiesterase